MPHRFLKRIDVRLTFTWLYCDPPPSQVASSDLRVFWPLIYAVPCQPEVSLG